MLNTTIKTNAHEKVVEMLREEVEAISRIYSDIKPIELTEEVE